MSAFTQPSELRLGDLHFEQAFVRELPGDPLADNTSRQVFEACFSRVEPTPVADPKLLAFSPAVASMIDLDEKAVKSDLFTQVFSGNRLLAGMEPFAMCYGGHQFGHWAGQLGDGRAITLGEAATASGQHYMLQLKGAGLTPYSRRADGLAVLRSSLREFLCSEAMHHLGIPTTRALSLITTGEDVVRDMFYDGNAASEPGAIVCRVAPSFVRFGNFEVFAARGDLRTLQDLVDYTIKRDFPELGSPSLETYARWFEEVCRRTAEMIVGWQRVGFVHGVMNTDNMSILGLTIDYGPYGWLEPYDLNWTPNTTDANGRRYRYGNQPDIGLWNAIQLAKALYPLIEETVPLERGLDRFLQTYESGWQNALTAKFGFREYRAESDEELSQTLFDLFKRTETDMTIFFRNLANVDIAENDLSNEQRFSPLLEAYYHPESLDTEYWTAAFGWLKNYCYRARLDHETLSSRKRRMDAVNPKYVLRNYLAQLAIDDAEKGNYELLHELQAVLRTPYVEIPGQARFAEKRPDWARNRAGCSMLSCSS